MGAGTGDPGHGDSGATLSMACSVPDAQQAPLTRCSRFSVTVFGFGVAAAPTSSSPNENIRQWAGMFMCEGGAARSVSR